MQTIYNILKMMFDKKKKIVIRKLQLGVGEIVNTVLI
jgi:hypothetical protein